MTRILTAMFVLALGAGMLAAQTPPAPPQPSPEKEPFIIQPGTVATGAQNKELRFVSTSPAGFTTSSARAPEVSFSPGVKLVEGSFQVLNQAEARCVVNVDEDAFGTIEVSIKFYGVKGESVLSTKNATLNVGGPLAVSGSQASISTDALLVRVNVPEAQAAGDVRITGRVTGSVTITAPTGTTFSGTPSVSVANGEANAPRLEGNNTVFAFSIGNPSGADVTAVVSEIRYSTALFTVAGGVMGALAVEITGGALGGQSALAVNAFTAKSEVEGENDVPETAPSSTPPGGTNNTGTGGGTATGGTFVPPRETNNRSSTNRPSTQSENRLNTPQGGQTAQPRWQGRGELRGGTGGGTPPQVPQRRIQQQQGEQQAEQRGGTGRPERVGVERREGGARQAPGVTPAQGQGSMGGIAPARYEGAEEGKSGSDFGQSLPRVRAPQDLPVAPGIYFCDREFNPVSAVVLDRLVAGEAGGRVWIKLVLPRTRTPDRVDTVTVRLTIGGNTRELILTETGPNTGEFRCSRDGVLIVAGEDPDSSTDPASREAVQPRPRVR